MKLTIDNNDNQGPQDYTPYLDATALPTVKRKLNRAWQMTAALVAADPSFVIPASGGRVVLKRNDGYKLFTGYLRTAHDVCEQHRDVATASLVEVWIDQAERRSWFLAETISATETAATR